MCEYVYAIMCVITHTFKSKALFIYFFTLQNKLRRQNKQKVNVGGPTRISCRRIRLNGKFGGRMGRNMRGGKWEKEAEQLWRVKKIIVFGWTVRKHTHTHIYIHVHIHIYTHVNLNLFFFLFFLIIWCTTYKFFFTEKNKKKEIKLQFNHVWVFEKKRWWLWLL